MTRKSSKAYIIQSIAPSYVVIWWYPVKSHPVDAIWLGFVGICICRIPRSATKLKNA